MLSINGTSRMLQASPVFKNWLTDVMDGDDDLSDLLAQDQKYFEKAAGQDQKYFKTPGGWPSDNKLIASAGKHGKKELRRGAAPGILNNGKTAGGEVRK
jgi:hypothetical protein